QLRAGLAREAPRDPRRQADLASSHHSVGIALRDLGRRAEALTAFREANAVRQRLADAYPQVLRYSLELAAGLTNVGVVASQDGRKDEALASYEQARDLLLKLHRREPDNFAVCKDLAAAHFNVGTACGALRRRGDENRELNAARRLQEGLVERDPDNLDVRCDLGRTLNTLGQNLMATGHAADAVTVLREAVTHQRLAHTRAPAVGGYRNNLNAHYGSLWEAFLLLERPDDAAAAILERR